MTEHKISTPEELDVVLGANALRKHAQLWKVAEGRSFRWADALGLACAVPLVVISIAQLSPDAGGAIQLGLGLLMMASFVGSHMQRQLNALVELVKRLERDHSGSSRNA